jgi:sugar lactone lactonase YvrE
MTVVAENLVGPNGLAISRSNRLVVAEIRGGLITEFDIDADTGVLSNRKIFVSTGQEKVPDGLCVDALGAVWYASPRTGEVLRILPGGVTADTIYFGPGKRPLACCLGGEDRKTLFVATAIANSEMMAEFQTENGFIESVRVLVEGDGLP